MSPEEKRIQQLEMEIAYVEYELVQWRSMAERYGLSSPKEVNDYITSLSWENV